MEMENMMEALARSKKMVCELRTCHVKSIGLASPPGLAYKSGFQRAILKAVEEAFKGYCAPS